MEDTFKSIRDVGDWQKKFGKRIELIDGMVADRSVVIPDNVLSDGMQSLDPNVISLAFRIYGLKDEPFVEPPVRGYIREVVSKRHAVASWKGKPAHLRQHEIIRPAKPVTMPSTGNPFTYLMF